jgi:hypothetical protein
MALVTPTGNGVTALFDRIDRAIAPFDIAGFADRSRADWYPVRATDLYGGASKLESSREEVQRMLESCGFVDGTLESGNAGVELMSNSRSRAEGPTIHNA